MGRIVAVVNQKGGVGKTTTAVNVAAYAAALGRRVLLVDVDAQGNATSGIGVDRSQLGVCLYDLLVQDASLPSVALDRVRVKTCVPGLDLVPATINLAGAEIQLASAIARETRLRSVLSGHRDGYDVVFLDTAPSLGLLTLNSLAAADGVMIPIQCEYYALEGLSQLLRVIGLVQRDLNPGLTVDGVVLTMYDGRTNLSREVADQVRSFFRGTVFGTTIPRNVRLAEAPSHGLPIALYDRICKGARAYRRLTMEVLGIDKARPGARS